MSSTAQSPSHHRTSAETFSVYDKNSCSAFECSMDDNVQDSNAGGYMKLTTDGSGSYFDKNDPEATGVDSPGVPTEPKKIYAVCSGKSGVPDNNFNARFENESRTVPKELFGESNQDSGFSTTSNELSLLEATGVDSFGVPTEPKKLFEESFSRNSNLETQNCILNSFSIASQSHSSRTDSSVSTKENSNTIPKSVVAPTQTSCNPTEFDSNELSPLLVRHHSGTTQLEVSSESTLKIPVEVAVFKSKKKTLLVTKCTVPVIKTSCEENNFVYCDPKVVLRDCAVQNRIEPLYLHMFGLRNSTEKRWLVLSEPFAPYKEKNLEFRIRYTVDATKDDSNMTSEMNDKKYSRRVEEVEEVSQYPVMNKEVLRYLFYQQRYDFLKNYPVNNDSLKRYRPDLCRDPPDLANDKVLIPALFDCFCEEVEGDHGQYHKNPLKLLPDSSLQLLNSSGFRSIIIKCFIKKRFHQLLNFFTISVRITPVEYFYQKYIDYVRTEEPSFHTEIFMLAKESGVITVDGDNGIVLSVNNLTDVLHEDVALDAPNGLRSLPNSDEKTETLIKLRLDFTDIVDMNLHIEGESDKVFLSDLLGRQMILEFLDKTTAQSFIECIVGYTRLLVDFYTDLPTSTCYSEVVHGPVTNKFLRHKLESNPSKYACGYRQSINDIGQYELMVKFPKVNSTESEYRSLCILGDKDGKLTLGSFPDQQVQFRNIGDVISSLSSGEYSAYFDQEVNKALKKVVLPNSRDICGLVVQRALQSLDDIDDKPHMPTIPQKDIENVKTNIGFPPGYFAKISIREYKGQTNSRERGRTRPVLLTSLFTEVNWATKQHINESFGESLKNLFIARHHCNVIRQLGVTVSDEKIFEYSEHGDLVSYLTDSLYTKKIDHQMNVTGSWLIQIFYQLAHALNFFEYKNIAHGAVRAKNIILFRTQPNPLIKLIHAGVRTIVRERSGTEIPALTPPWIAKEYCHFPTNKPLKTATIAGDKWSFATTVCEIALIAKKNTPIQDDCTVSELTDDMIQRYNSGNVLTLPRWMDSGLTELKFSTVLRQCWQADPKQRPTFLKFVRLLAKLMHNKIGQDESFSLPNRERGQSEVAQITGYHDSDLIHIREEPLGTGFYGKVHLCMHKITKEKLAVKDISNMTGMWSWDNFRREMQTMLSVNHENIVAVKGIALTSSRIVMEYLPLGSLLDFLKRNHGKVSIRDRINFSQDIAKGMKELRKNKILHRDLALRNVLVASKEDGSNIAKISDFGLARYVAENDYYYKDLHSSQTGFPFPWYAPECLEGDYVHTRFESEVWSYGITLWELFSYPELRMPSSEPQSLLRKIKEKRWPSQPDRCPSEIYENIIAKCCQIKLEDRITFQQAIDALEKEKNSYFRN